MKIKKLALISLVVLLVGILGATISFTAAGVEQIKAAWPNLFRWGYTVPEGWNWEDYQHATVISGSEKEENFDLSELKELQIEVSGGRLEISRSAEAERLTINYSARSRSGTGSFPQLKSEKDGQKLRIWVDRGTIKRLNFNQLDAYIEISVIIPASYTGDLALEMNAMKAELGALEGLRKLSLECNAGELKTEKLQAETAQLSLAAGKNEVGEMIIDKKVELEVNAGSCTISALQAKESDISVNAGDCNIYRMAGAASADFNAGYLELTFERVDGDIELTGNLGHGSLMFPADASIRVDARMPGGQLSGSIALENMKQSRTRFSGEKNGGSYQVDISGRAGQIEIGESK